MSFNVFITEEDFRKERARRDREELKFIEVMKSVNKKYIAYVRGYDSDYDPNPAPNQDE
jgi:hypothetical protein